MRVDYYNKKTKNMIYTAKDIMLMDEISFCSTFSGFKVKVTLTDNSIIEGFVYEIGLSGIVNPHTKDNLPIDINVNGQKIWLPNISKIEKL